MFKTKKEKLEKEILENELENTEPDETGSPESAEEEQDTQPVNTEADGKKKNNKGIKELEARSEALKDQLLRKAAEFENYKRRTENDISNLYKFANESLITDLLPALEDFSRVMKLWDEKHDAEAFHKGVELVYEKFRKTLEKQGLKEIDSMGKPFDVNLHDAIMQMEKSEADPDTILDVVEKGYKLKDKVIRHSKVVVSKKPE